MSRERSLVYNRAFPKNPGRCRNCGNTIPAGSGRWSSCSQPCADFIQFCVFTSHQRHLVAKRDRGVCAICGTDTRKVERILRWLRKRAGSYPYGVSTVFAAEVWRWATKILTDGDGTGWDMDHIKPVSEGGGVDKNKTVAQMMLNLRTLCKGCHKQETRLLHIRLSGKLNRVKVPTRVRVPENA